MKEKLKDCGNRCVLKYRSQAWSWKLLLCQTLELLQSNWFNVSKKEWSDKSVPRKLCPWLLTTHNRGKSASDHRPNGHFVDFSKKWHDFRFYRCDENEWREVKLKISPKFCSSFSNGEYDGELTIQWSCSLEINSIITGLQHASSCVNVLFKFPRALFVHSKSSAKFLCSLPSMLAAFTHVRFSKDLRGIMDTMAD